MYQPHALAAAARGRLDHEGIADLSGRADQVRIRQAGLGAAGDHADPGRRDGLLGPDLVAHRLNGLRRRTDEDQPGGGAGPREGVVLGQEAIAGMNRLSTGRRSGVQDPVGRQVTRRGGRGPDPDRDVGVPDMPGARVRVAVDGH